MSLDAVLAACRLLHDAALMLTFGCSAFLLLLLPPRLRSRIDLRLWPLLCVAVCLIALTSLAALPVQTGQIVGSWQAMLDPVSLLAILHTRIGRVWIIGMLLALLLLANLWLPRQVRLAALLPGSALLLASLAWSGHAAMDEGWLGWLHTANHVIHLLCAAAWLGSLLPFIVCLRLLDDAAEQLQVMSALRRFSQAGHIAVAGVLLTGAINTRLILGRWLTNLSSPYQIMLSVKIVLVLAMVTLALLNRYVLVPRMRQYRQQSIARLRWGSVAEIALGVAAIGLVALFGMLEPV